MKNFTRFMFISTILLVAGSGNMWAWRGAKAIVKSEPANGGYVYVSKSNSAPTTYDKTQDESTQEENKTGNTTFTFYRFYQVQPNYVFKGWVETTSQNSGTSNSSVGISAGTAWWGSYTEKTYYAIFARMTADKSTMAYEATKVGQSALQSITITHAHAGKITANISGDNASDFSISSTTPVANSVSEGTQDITVTFAPTCNGTRAAIFTLHSDNGLSDIVISLTGEGVLNGQTLTWDNEPIDPNMTLGNTLNISATATSGLGVTYTSSDPQVISVNGNTLTANKVGTAVITASQAGDCTFAAAESITKQFTVNDKATPTFWLNNVPEQTEANLKVGESITINIENISGALQSEYNTDYLSIILGEGIITVTAMGATENAMLTLTQPETETIFSASRTFTFHITKNTATLTNDLAAEYKVDDEIAFTNLYTASNDEVAVTIISSNETVLKINGDKLVAVGAGTAEITIAQAENYKWKALSATKSVTVTKYANTIVWAFGNETSYNKTLSYDETVNINVTSDNTDIETSPISITQNLGEDIATYNAEQQIITASYHEGTATWIVSQPEDRKFLAADTTITVTVAPLQGGCDIVNNSDEFDVPFNSTKGEITWADTNAAAQLTFDAKMQFWSTGNMEIEAYINGNWTKIQSIGTGSLSSDSYKPFSYDLAAEVQGIRFKNAGTLSRYVKNVRISRRQHITPSATTITLPTSEIGVQTTANFTLTWSSCADEIRLACSNPKFSIDKTVISTNGSAGSANVVVTYSSTEMETAEATLTIYTPYQQTAVALNATTGKSTQSITWLSCPTTIETTAEVRIEAAAQTPVHIISSDSTTAYVENGKLLIIKYGTITLTAIAEESEMYEEATLAQDITIMAVTPEITALPVASNIRIGQSFSESVLTTGSADVDGMFIWEDNSDNYLAISTEGDYTAYVMFIPSDLNWYAIVHNLPIPVKVENGAATGLQEIRDNVSPSATRKVLIDGQIYLIRGGETYDLQGRIIRK